MQVYFTPLDAPISISVQHNVDDAVRNKGLVTEGRKKHFHIQEFSKHGSINYLAVKTFDQNITIACASMLKVERNYSRRSMPHRTFEIRVNKGETICFTKYFSLHSSWHLNSNIVRSRAIKTCVKESRHSFGQLLKSNTQAWNRKWNIADIMVRGPGAIDRALRFNIYHMLIVGNDDGGLSSIGAKTLSGEGYRGHVF
ncbi:MAG: hypothetical protein GF384_05270, partial [Elusimicrobia bacterium]|nr:hypothetical protein [Elusimicrobiota bacterium]MBD3412199.1 hypothetical protein [Elusimicrobiota bacterium]